MSSARKIAVRGNDGVAACSQLRQAKKNAPMHECAMKCCRWSDLEIPNISNKIFGDVGACLFTAGSSNLHAFNWSFICGKKVLLESRKGFLNSTVLLRIVRDADTCSAILLTCSLPSGWRGDPRILSLLVNAMNAVAIFRCSKMSWRWRSTS